jgi:hypothetical protein
VDRLAAYLTIPSDYGQWLGGLRWSPAADAIESVSGKTFCLVDQLGLFLEGLLGVRPAPHFAHVLHLLLLLGHGNDALPVAVRRLAAAYRDAGRPPRTAGALCSELSRSVPSASSPPRLEQLLLKLKLRVLSYEVEPANPVLVETPCLSPAEFERRVAEALRPFSEDDLRHWLRHGCPPLADAGRRLAEPLQSPPPRDEPLAEVLRRRPRLAGAVALAPVLAGSLTLPPRRLSRHEQPVGGYADVTNRGDPERLLPSQLALDGLDFVRRYAERELLYFRREEPRDRQQPELRIVLDQGVRTWGGVRLALAAAVVALLGRDRRRTGDMRLTIAELSGIDPHELKPDELADVLEASDLSPHPAALLAEALGGPDGVVADVVLLTHPRSLQEPAVREAAAQARPGQRLFALAVDGDGRAELHELRRGGSVRLRSFRVDLTAATAVRPSATPTAPAAGERPWTGDIEPVPFPARMGLFGKVRHLAFDAAGEWLLAVGPRGLLHLSRVGDSGPPELLPRGFRDGAVLSHVEAVLGTAGGFAVCGWLTLSRRPETFQIDSTRSPPDEKMRFLIAVVYYDLTRRDVALHLLAADDEAIRHWFAFPELHAVAVKKQSGPCSAVDLATGGQHPSGGPLAAITPRAVQAQMQALRLELPPPAVQFVRDPADLLGNSPRLWFDSANGALHLGGISAKWPPLVPTADGMPRLAHARYAPETLQMAGPALAGVFHPAPYKEARLLLIEGPEGRVLGEYPAGPFMLSADGRLIARQTGDSEWTVHETAGGRPPLSVVPAARPHSEIGIHFGGVCLAISVGKLHHLFSWTDGTLRHELQRGAEPKFPGDLAPTALARGWTVRRRETLPALFRYDPERFVIVTSVLRGLVAVGDRYGLVTLARVGEADEAGQVVAQFFVHKERAAAWLPDGTRWGDPVLAGGLPSPRAASTIGLALLPHEGGAR